MMLPCDKVVGWHLLRLVVRKRVADRQIAAIEQRARDLRRQIEVDRAVDNARLVLRRIEARLIGTRHQQLQRAAVERDVLTAGIDRRPRSCERSRLLRAAVVVGATNERRGAGKRLCCVGQRQRAVDDVSIGGARRIALAAKHVEIGHDVVARIDKTDAKPTLPALCTSISRNAQNKNHTSD
jgi:hypothetical protein